MSLLIYDVSSSIEDIINISDTTTRLVCKATGSSSSESGLDLAYTFGTGADSTIGTTSMSPYNVNDYTGIFLKPISLGSSTYTRISRTTTTYDPTLSTLVTSDTTAGDTFFVDISGLTAGVSYDVYICNTSAFYVVSASNYTWKAYYISAKKYNSDYVVHTFTAGFADMSSLTDGDGAQWQASTEDDAGLIWEAGVGGFSYVQNTGLERAAPIITFSGLLENPILANLTNNETLAYTGIIGEGQSLVVDTAARTALLGGMNSATNISGDWLTLSPGRNKFQLSADSYSDSYSCTIKYRSVVG